MAKAPIAVAYGDGIGPEIMTASLRILEAAGAELEQHPIEIGERVYLSGVSSGITQETWDIIQETKTIYKAPITTPLGGGYKSLNVTLRKALNLYANVRPSASYFPAVDTKHPLMDLVIVRENEEDLYAGIEHRQTPEVYQTLKLITRPGSERVIRYAFEFTKRNGRKKVTCFTKNNIMKLSDGIFQKIFFEVAKDYPEIEADHMIIDIGTAKLSSQPERFDVIVAPNLYGDIISDVASELTGSVGLGTSSNIGDEYAMFEAVHGSAPDIAGRGIANPSGLLLAGVRMLVHLGQSDVATRVHNAWKRTLEDGIHTADIYKADRSQTNADTDTFADAVIQRLGQMPETLKPVSYEGVQLTRTTASTPTLRTEKQLVGVDVFLDWDDAGRDPDVIGNILRDKADNDEIKLVMITNRGQKVFPLNGAPRAFCTDHWRCRFQTPGEGPLPGKGITHQHIVDLLHRAAEGGLDFIKMENR